MPAVSKKQQKFFGIVRAIQKGEMAPTTPETAKAAADMKKGDVKKFASTKHKGLPEKKKIVEDKQVKKIIKQLRKSVKSHEKQADTLEKKVKTFKESAFTNITTGNKIGQTFQHATGATITIDNTMSDPSDLPSQVTLDLGAGETITVDAPTTNEYGIAGITSSLGNAGGGGGVQTRQPTKTANEINQQLDASKEASGAETAKVEDSIQTKIQNIIGIIKQGVHVIDKIKKLGIDPKSTLMKEMTIQTIYHLANSNFFGVSNLSSKTERFNSELKVLFGYLSGNIRGNITNDFISEKHLNDIFKTATLHTDKKTNRPSGRVQMDDFIVGSGQQLVFTPSSKASHFGSSLNVSLEFNYDFDKNAVEIEKSDPNIFKKVLGPLLFGDYVYDGSGFSPLIQHAKDTGRAKPIKGKFNISMNKLFKLNPDLIRKHMEFNLVGKYFAEPWTVDMMRQSMFSGKPVNQIPSIKAGVHAYYALTGQLPPQSVAIGSKEYQEMQLGKYNFGDHPEYDPEVIANIDKLRKVAKSNAAFGKVGGGNAGSYVPPTGDVFDRDDVSFKKKDYEKNRKRGYSRLKVTDPNRPARRVDPSKIVGRGFRIPRGTPRSQIVGRFRGRGSGYDVGGGLYEESNPNRPKKLKEQTTFAQMQQRIRDAKEKRREQQKKSEKLYMDTKRKGVKFYDKKGTGRLKDGKKIYD